MTMPLLLLIAALAAGPVPAAEAPAAPTWDELLQKPDDVELNYRYAKAQAAAGHMRDALAALERILTLHPELTNIRLFYAFALYRMGSAEEARRQLDLIETNALPAELRGQVEDLRRRLRLESKRTSLSGQLGAGWGYDTNRNFSPASGESLFFDTVLPTPGPQNDTRQIQLGAVQARRDLGFDAGHEVFASFNLYRSRQTQLHALDLQVLSGQLGAALRTDWVDITPAALADYVDLRDHMYYRSAGASLKLSRDLKPGWTVYGEGRQNYQDFRPTDFAPLADQRRGTQTRAALGTQFPLGPAMRGGIVVNYSWKRAVYKPYAFQRRGVELTHLWMVGRGIALTVQGTYSDDWYAEPEPLISFKYRHDHSWRANAGLALPLSLVWQPLSDLAWTLNYEYEQALSNLPNYAYTNNAFFTLLSYRWAVGW